MTRTITAMFGDRSKAEAAVDELVQGLGINRSQVQVHAADAGSTSATAATTANEGGFWASLKDLFVPDEDRSAFAEGIRRGNVVVSAAVDEAKTEHAMDILENHGAVDLDAQEAEWKQSGWKGYEGGTTTAATVASSPATSALGVVATGVATGAAATTTTAAAPAAVTAARTGGDEVIPIVEERIRVGKRAAEGGRVRVRSFVVETPVSEQVKLHEERVSIERHAVNRPLTDADAAFRDRTIEAVEHTEEAVVSKDARVTEELVLRKEGMDRTETVTDTVRRTEVEVDDTTDLARTTGTASVAGATTANPPGTAASRAVDKTLGTNVSGANPGKR